MKRNVICISRSLAAGGEEIARLIADETGFRYTDDEIIVDAAQELGVSPEQVAEVETTPGLVGRSQVLRVLVTAPPSVRALRLVGQNGGSEDEANNSIAESDSQRERYLRRFYQIEHELPTHYDVVLNTEHPTPELATQMIVKAAGG